MARTGSQAGPAAEPDDFERGDGNRIIIKVAFHSQQAFAQIEASQTGTCMSTQPVHNTKFGDGTVMVKDAQLARPLPALAVVLWLRWHPPAS